MQVNSIDTSNIVSVAPFVDNYTAEDSAPDSNQEAVQNEAKIESNDSESNIDESNNSDAENYDKILDLEQNQQKILSLLNVLINKQQSKDDSNVSDENASETESEDTEISNKEGYNMHTKVFKHATEDDVLDEPLTADEVLDTVVDEGIGFEEVKDDAKEATPEAEQDKSAVNNGDNEAGSTEEPEDYPELQPVTTATAMRLADKYIKAGVINEAHRFDAIERMSKMSKIAARNQMIAIDMLTKANKVKADKLAKMASKKYAKTEIEELEDGNVSITITEEDGSVLGFTGPKDKGDEFLARHNDADKTAKINAKKIADLSEDENLDEIEEDDDTEPAPSVEEIKRDIAKRKSARKSARNIVKMYAKKTADLYEDEDLDEDEDDDDDVEPAPSVEEIKRDIAKREAARYKLYAAKKSMLANKPSTSQFVRASKLSRMAKLNSDKKLARTPRVAGITESTDAAMSLL